MGSPCGGSPLGSVKAVPGARARPLFSRRVSPDWDVIVVGGGAAGAVIASRVSEDENLRVLLLEAGPDTVPGAEPADVLDVFYVAAYNPAYLWPKLRVKFPAPPFNAAPVFYEQARVLGGGSSINSMVALRGLPGDFARWVDLGASGWSWTDVLPYYRKLESDLDFDGPLHGRTGPIPIRRHPKTHWPPFCRAVERALSSRGYRFVSDMNSAPPMEGYGAVPMSNLPTQRVSTAMGYLGPEVRRRRNLQILTDTEVETLRTDGTRITGVTARRGGDVRTYAARETVISAGSLHSPALLLRAGIGPSADLRALGVTVIADRPGVGANLHDHPVTTLAAYIAPAAKQAPQLRAHANLALRYGSGVPGCAALDMYLAVLNKSSWHPLGERLASMLVVLNEPVSRGRLTLRSPDPEDEPRVDFNLLADPRDCMRLADGLRLAGALLEATSVGGLVKDRFLATFSERGRKLNRPRRLNRIKSAGAVLLLDALPPLRRSLLRRVAEGGGDLPALLGDHESLAAWLRRSVTGFFHPVGTCRMGDERDPHAVVDPYGRVYGVQGLRVVDASVMPRIVRANTNLTTIMIAEKMAGAIRRARRTDEHLLRVPRSGGRVPVSPPPARPAARAE